MNESLSFETLRAGASLLARSGRTLEVRFSGSSMRPTIEPGQPVILRCGSVPLCGDVVVTATDESLIVHRLIATGPGWILTRGDANPLPDPPLFADLRLDVGTISGLAMEGGIRAVPPHSSTAMQSLIGACARLMVRIHPPIAAVMIRFLWIVRRALWLRPRKLLSS